MRDVDEVVEPERKRGNRSPHHPLDLKAHSYAHTVAGPRHNYVVHRGVIVQPGKEFPGPPVVGICIQIPIAPNDIGLVEQDLRGESAGTVCPQISSLW